MAFDLKKGGTGSAKPGPGAPRQNAEPTGKRSIVPIVATIGGIALIAIVALMRNREGTTVANDGGSSTTQADSQPAGAATAAAGAATSPQPAPAAAESARSATAAVSAPATSSTTTAETRPPTSSTPTQPPANRNAAVVPVQFAAGSFEVAAPDDAIVSSILERLQKSPTARITVVGHASSDGPDEWNTVLSRRRAEAFKAYLAGRGVAAERIDIDAKGSAEPLGPNDTAAGRRQNRRVDVRF